MGTYLKTQIGPYIKFPKQYKIVNEEVRTCGKHETKSKNEFCSKCGNKILTIPRTVKKEISFYDLLDNDNLVDYEENDIIYLFSNKDMLYSIDTEVNEFRKITPLLIEYSIDEFKEKHKEDIQILESKIGTKIQVEFGFVNYWG